MQVTALRSKCTWSTLQVAPNSSVTVRGARPTPPTVVECVATCSANVSDAASESSPLMRSRKRLRKAVSSLSGLSRASNCSKNDSRPDGRFPTLAEFDQIFAPSVLSDLVQQSKQMLKIFMTTVGPGAASWNHATTLADKVLELAKVGRLPSGGSIRIL